MNDKITVKQAMNLLDVSDQTIYGMINSGKLHKYQPTGPRGRLYVYRNEVLDVLRQFEPEEPPASSPKPLPVITADMIMAEVEKNRAEKAENPNSNRHNGRIDVYFSDEDYQIIEQMSASEGIAKSEFVRKSVHRDIRMVELLNDYLETGEREDIKDDC